jgi:hypothetical protein
VSECQEETEQDPGGWERAAVWGKVREAENPTAWADPVRLGRQATAYARSAGTGNRINVEFPAWIGNVLSAGLQ